MGYLVIFAIFTHFPIDFVAKESYEILKEFCTAGLSAALT